MKELFNFKKPVKAQPRSDYAKAKLANRRAVQKKYDEAHREERNARLRRDYQRDPDKYLRRKKEWLDRKKAPF